MKKAMTGTSWTPDCPVRLADLSAVRVTYFGFDNTVHDGIIVLHKRFAEEALAVFDELYAIRFPINNVAPWCYYCRKADDTPEEWTGHAYGIAIDVNPLENPFRHLKTGWWPKGSGPRVPRDDGEGKIAPSTEAFRIFTRHGWA